MRRRSSAGTVTRGVGFRSAGVVRAGLCVSALAASGCFPPGSGLDPDPNEIYFPTGLVLSKPIGSDEKVAELSSGDIVTPECAEGTGPGTQNPCDVASLSFKGVSGVTRRWLYVANSDFDLQFNQGTVQVFDLDAVHGALPDLTAANPCAPRKTRSEDLGKQAPPEAFLNPGPCGPLVDLNPVLKTSVKIGAFATDIVYMRRPPDDPNNPDVTSSPEGRLLVPVRGDDTLHWIDTFDKDGRLECGAGADGACDSNHRRGNDPAKENTRDATLPPEPFGIAADQRGESIVTTHQSDGELGLFVNDWNHGPNGGPDLQFVMATVAQNPIGVASVPEADVSLALRGTKSETFYEPGYFVTFLNAAQIQLVRYVSDRPAAAGGNPRPFLDPGNAQTIFTNSQGFDSRGIAVDGSARKACESVCVETPGPPSCRASCVGTQPTDTQTTVDSKSICDASVDASGPCVKYVACLRACAATPLDVYVANRTPPTLILGQTQTTPSPTSSDDAPLLNDNLQVSQGPSRVVVGNVLVPGPGGTRILKRRVFIICFDSQQIFVYDPDALRFEAVIRTGRGPHSLAVDETRGLGYVGHFTDSYIGVVGLDQSNTETYGKMFLTIGQPVAPRAQK